MNSLNTPQTNNQNTRSTFTFWLKGFMILPILLTTFVHENFFRSNHDIFSMESITVSIVKAVSIYILLYCLLKFSPKFFKNKFDILKTIICLGLNKKEQLFGKKLNGPFALCTALFVSLLWILISLTPMLIPIALLPYIH